MDRIITITHSYSWKHLGLIEHNYRIGDVVRFAASRVPGDKEGLEQLDMGCNDERSVPVLGGQAGSRSLTTSIRLDAAVVDARLQSSDTSRRTRFTLSSRLAAFENHCGLFFDAHPQSVNQKETTMMILSTSVWAGGNKGVRSGGNYTHCIPGGSPTPCFYSGPRPHYSIIFRPGGESRKETADYFLTMLPFLSSRRVNMGRPSLSRGWRQSRCSTDGRVLMNPGRSRGARLIRIAYPRRELSR